MREIKFRAWQRDPITSEWHMIQSLGHWKVYELNSPTPDEEIVMQYTGLKDKNGVEIYEGDILSSEHYNNNPWVVEWDSDYARFAVTGASDDEWLEREFASYREVIGNIYENPELLT